MNKVKNTSSYVLKKITNRLQTPLVESVSNGKDEQRVRSILSLYGQNSTSYLSLEKDKKYFFGIQVKGFLAYGIVHDVIIVEGDPICAASNMMILIQEFKDYCIDHGYSIIFINITPSFLKYYRNKGFAYVKTGEEARFDLTKYSLKGGKAAKIRASINHARKFCSIYEYCPLTERNYNIEHEILKVSNEWFEKKKTGELIFTMGTIGFDNPLDKRYFYAVDSADQIVGFTVFIPFVNNGGKGYMADITRRRETAPGGVSELILYESFNKFKKEGIRWGSLGVAPLARVTTDKVPAESKFLSHIFNFVYEKMNSVYGFKSLFHAKKQYAPTFWEPSFYAYWPRIFTPYKGYAIIRIQNPKGIIDYIQAFMKKPIQKIQNIQLAYILKRVPVPLGVIILIDNYHKIMNNHFGKFLLFDVMKFYSKEQVHIFTLLSFLKHHGIII